MKRETLQILRHFCRVPLSHQNLVGRLKSYKRPNDKISYWVAQGYLIPLAKGLYAVNEDICGTLPSAMLIANSLYGPSYVSLDYALAYYGAIPESVAEITSVTTRRSKSTTTPLGRYSYTHLPLPYYSYGIVSQPLEGQLYALLAGPEKALTDMIVCSRKLLLRSRKDALYWLEDMRIDENWLAGLDLQHFRLLMEHAPKRNSLLQVLKTLPEYVA